MPGMLLEWVCWFAGAGLSTEIVGTLYIFFTLQKYSHYRHGIGEPPVAK
jgi:hypothetical protein